MQFLMEKVFKKQENKDKNIDQELLKKYDENILAQSTLNVYN